MSSDSRALRRELRGAGLTTGAIDAVWPEWWSAAAEGSPSAAAELRYTVARRLGVSPRSLFDGPPRFVWRDRAKYKNLGDVSADEVGILSSFGVAVGTALIPAAPRSVPLPASAAELRQAVLAKSQVVNYIDLLAFAWGVGVPVIQLRLFPLKRKRMHAMTIQAGERYAVLLGRETRFPAQAAFMIAHEIGHMVLHHLSGLAALLDVEDPLRVSSTDEEENSADKFALELLTGDPDPQVVSNLGTFNANELSHAAIDAAAEWRVDPGVLALCLAHSTGHWRQGFAALRMMPPGEVNVGDHVNGIALSQLDFSTTPLDSRDYLARVMGVDLAS